MIMTNKRKNTIMMVVTHLHSKEGLKQVIQGHAKSVTAQEVTNALRLANVQIAIIIGQITSGITNKHRYTFINDFSNYDRVVVNGKGEIVK